VIRIVVTDEQRSVDIRVDVEYSPDVFDDLGSRALRLMLSNDIPEPAQPDVD
jgi:hypothetical protein